MIRKPPVAKTKW